MKKILLLHGALGSKAQLQPLQNALSGSIETAAINFSGHGGEKLPSAYDFELFAQDIIRWQNKNGVTTIDIFGYSMGGYAALYLALKQPERVGKIFTLGTKLFWDEASSIKEVKMLNPEVIAEKVPAFAQKLKETHSPQNWKVVLQLTADMMMALGKDAPLKEAAYTSIQHEVLLAVGDKDIMAGVEDTLATYRLLPNASLMVLPQTPHPIEKVQMEKLVPEIICFFNS